MLTGKAQTLEHLRERITVAKILPLVVVAREEWKGDPALVVDRIRSTLGTVPLIVRSSASAEDREQGSSAGVFDSVLDVTDDNLLGGALDRVFASYEREGLFLDSEHALVQPMVIDAILSGVASARDHVTGAPYRVINWVDGSDTTGVTAGRRSDTRTWYGTVGVSAEGSLACVTELLDELVQIFSDDRLEVEFALSASDGLILFQVRRLTGLRRAVAPAHAVANCVAERIDARLRRHDGIGSPIPRGQTLLGVMPDWNPAEMIGIRPRRLATSLYRLLITDDAWSDARKRYGYHGVAGEPLMVDLGGIPLIDVRVSATTLVPADVGPDLTRRLVDFYVEKLSTNPQLHDKFEFEVVMSCWGPRSKQWLERDLASFARNDLWTLESSLKKLTNDVLFRDKPWKDDIEAFRKLAKSRAKLVKMPRGSLRRIQLLLSSARNHGTIPFAGLARAAFMATHILSQCIEIGVVSPDAADGLLARASRVSRGLVDAWSEGGSALLDQYGHLRPGTYDIRSKRYDQSPDIFDAPLAVSTPRYEYEAVDTQRLEPVLRDAGLETSGGGFLDVLDKVVAAREMAKLEFSRNVSDALEDIAIWGEERGLDREMLSHLNISTILTLSDGDLMTQVGNGIREAEEARSVVLPPLIRTAHDARSFEVPSTIPNFLGHTRVTAELADVVNGDAPGGKIAVIESADPGFDWIFATRPMGLITAYGGVNSHMAIRAREFNIPAAIGIGREAFERIVNARMVTLDPGSHLLQVIQ